MSNEIEQWQADYLGQVIRIWTEKAPNHYTTTRFAWLMDNSNNFSKLRKENPKP